MATLTPPPSVKRKRTFDEKLSDEKDDCSPLRSNIKILPSRPVDDPESHVRTNHSNVAGHMQKLDLSSTADKATSQARAKPTNPHHVRKAAKEDSSRHSLDRPKEKAAAKHLNESLALWWSDAEITGHQLDPHDPTDDGLGINGIGFVQTPANAFARARKREKQVQDWKERENREARIRRGHRRRQRHQDVELRNLSDPENVADTKRVRFLS